MRVNADGTGLFNNSLTGVVTPLDPADIKISGNHFTASVPLGLMTPAATLRPEQWTYNLWPRNGVGRNVQVGDLAPDDGNSPVQVLSKGDDDHGRKRKTDAATRTEAVAGGSGVKAVAAGDVFSDVAPISDDVLGADGRGAGDLLQ